MRQPPFALLPIAVAVVVWQPVLLLAAAALGCGIIAIGLVAQAISVRGHRRLRRI